jgi:AraC-like DNA-binding protein
MNTVLCTPGSVRIPKAPLPSFRRRVSIRTTARRYRGTPKGAPVTVTVILDTELLPRHERADAIEQAMQLSGIPARLTHEPPIDEVFARIELWPLGGGSTLMHRDGSGVCLTRTPRQVRAVAPERIAVTVLGPGRWTYAQGGHDQQVESHRPEMVVTDHAVPYEFSRIGGGETFSLNLDHATLGLPIDRVHAAVGLIASSPVYPLVRDTILQLNSTLIADPAGRTWGLLGNAATELVRALIISATEDQTRQHISITDSLGLRIRLYLEAHLRDRELTPSRIAHDHHISLRQLYNVWARTNGQPLGQWLIAQRLDAARRDLARPDSRIRTIAAVARDCGFVDTAHFARTFRRTYGMSPREWRAIARSDGSAGAQR